ncbi:MAG: addiction module antitoxin, partial [Alphaproteobacteria bacterium PA3]
MLEALAGEISYQELERRIATLLPIDATPVWSGSSLRGVISKIDVLFAIKDAVTIADLQRFFDVAKLVLAEENPALELPEKDRWAAGIYGKTRQISGALRNGLAETLARLGFDAEVHVNNLVRNLLTPLTAVTLESQTDNLPLYAEAAPETFLSIIEADLQLPEPEALNLMRPIGDAFFSSSPRTGLLWALEGLAWSPT